MQLLWAAAAAADAEATDAILVEEVVRASAAEAGGWRGGGQQPYNHLTSNLYQPLKVLRDGELGDG
eukprot:scaffold18048_cov101-Isochrysis_galbana.AAC.1